MLSKNSTFIGIDPTSGHKSFTYAVLDKDLRLLALAEGEMEDVIAFVAGQQPATVAVNAPAGVNLGLVREMLKKAMPTPTPTRGAEFRVAEYELRQRGILVAGTPASVSVSPAWMQLGFELYRRLEQLGFKKYPAENQSSQILETHPHACFCVMAGGLPLSKPSLEGKLQRQLILYEHGVGISDPMDFFEEITRHKITKGLWPTQLLYPPEQLDALVAAYVAWLAINKPGHVCSFGDQNEGMIVLPGNELKEKY
ncbi:MAG: DUF429 domain-containing protein [Anaerolineales bacterium]|nr:DUF429 domain-containing protein [Anaerolineales bacterium]